MCKVLDPSFFFQAEDGIRDYMVTGVQTCALPISNAPSENSYLQTSDGGNTWTFRTMAAAGAGGCVLADSIFFPPSNLPFNQREGWAADNCILHTVDGGQTWTEQRVNGVLHGESS